MLHFIYNPVGGMGKAKRKIAKLTAYCAKRSIPYSVHATEYAGHIKTIIADLESQGPCDIVVLGGDGTFHEALNGITDFSKVRLGLIASGSGNDFVGSGNFHKKHPIRALKTIIAGKTKNIDYIQFDCGVRCINIAGTGLDTEVLKVARAMRRLTGKPDYIKALFRVINNFNPYDVKATVDGEVFEHECIIAGAANGIRLGGGIFLSPLSSITDGKMNFVLVKMIPRNKIKRAVFSVILGTHLKKYYTVHREAERIEITSPNHMLVELDGETYDIPFACSVVKQGLTVFLD